MPLKIYYVDPRKPIIIITWKGFDPLLPTILLNSHMDVVPVFKVSFNFLTDIKLIILKFFGYFSEKLFILFLKIRIKIKKNFINKFLHALKKCFHVILRKKNILF